MSFIIIDFETRSRVDLKKHGGYRYAADPSTDIICMAAYDMATSQSWLWTPVEPLPAALITALMNPDNLIVAHNAEFDRNIWEYVGVDYGLPEIPFDRWYCSAAQCRVNALPGGLDKASQAITGKKQKLATGARLIKELSLPQKDGTFNLDPIKLKEMADYCVQDVVATVDIIRATRPMTQQEHQDWLVSERINERGVRVDIQAATLAKAYSERERAVLSEVLQDTTNNQVTKVTQHIRVKAWVAAMLEREGMTDALKMMERRVNGEVKQSMDKAVRTEILASAQSGDIPQLTEELYTVIDTMQQASNTSTAKFAKMLDLADPLDHRVRGAFMFSGASQTGRYSSKGLQVHNFKRDCLTPDEADLTILKMMSAGSVPNTLDTLAKLLRPALIPARGHTFVIGDWSAIEGRVLPWLSGSGAGSEAVLDVFRSGEDIYMHTAKTMGVYDRQIGKVATLALGYQGGVNAFNSMARNYGLYLKDEESARVVKAWRVASPWAVRFWKLLNAAAIRAIKTPGAQCKAGKVAFMFTPNMLDGTLICFLPGGYSIQYPKARLEIIDSPYNTKELTVTCMKASITPEQGAKEWPRAAPYGGMLAENCIAEGTMVLTTRGWVAIQHIAATDLVHDGVTFVTHGGLLFKGLQTCVTVDGVQMTPEHKVLTDEGWKKGREDPRPYRPEIWNAHSDTVYGVCGWEAAMGVLLRLREPVCEGWERGIPEAGAARELRMPNEENAVESEKPRHVLSPCLSGMEEYAMQVSVAFSSGMEKLWGAWHKGVQTLGYVRELLGRYGRRVSKRTNPGQIGQRWGLLQRKLPLGHIPRAGKQPKGEQIHEHPCGANDGRGRIAAVQHRCVNAPVPHTKRVAGEQVVSNAGCQKQVYDIVNCGPSNRFIVRGIDGPFIVHNCTQAVAANLLKESLRQLDNVVLHVHDEIVLEVPEDEAEKRSKELQEVMEKPPSWAKGLPLKAEPKIMRRYGK